MEFSWLTLLVRCQVLTLQVHHDEVLLVHFLLVNELVHLDDPLIVSEFAEEFVLGLEDLARFVLLLHLQGNFNAAQTIGSLISHT